MIPFKVTVYLPGAADCEALTESKMEDCDTGPAGRNKQHNCLFVCVKGPTVKATPGTKKSEGKFIVTSWLAERTFWVVKLTAAFNEHDVTKQSEQCAEHLQKICRVCWEHCLTRQLLR